MSLSRTRREITLVISRITSAPLYGDGTLPESGNSDACVKGVKDRDVTYQLPLTMHHCSRVKALRTLAPGFITLAM